MKRNLGNIVLLWILSVGYAYGGANYVWSILQAPSALYVNEGGTIRYQCAFDTSAAEYTVEFKPKNAKEYTASMVTQSDKVIGRKRILTFDVLITPKTEGLIKIRLDALIRHTTFASIENATIGRDNVKKYDFIDEKAFLPKVDIEVRPNTTALSGEVSLRVVCDKSEARAHEPIHLSVYVRGKGNLDQFVPYELNISGVKVYSQAPMKNLTLTQEGYEGEIRQEFALVADKNYVIPSFRLSVLDTKSHTPKMLQSKPFQIQILPGYNPASLVDPPEIVNRSPLKHYAIYAFFTLLGIMLGEVFRRLWKLRPRRKVRGFWDQAKSEKELSVLLALNGNSIYEPIIRELDAKTIDLKAAKLKIKTLISEEK